MAGKQNQSVLSSQFHFPIRLSESHWYISLQTAITFLIVALTSSQSFAYVHFIYMYDNIVFKKTNY